MTGWYIAIALGLVLANAFFVAGEFAVIAARKEKVEALAARGNPAASLALKSSRELSFMLAAAQLGITMASLGLGFVAEPAVAHLIEAGIGELIELPAEALHSIAFVVALIIISFLHMVLGEMAPKNIAIAQPERSALWLALPFRAYANLFRPMIAMFNWLANHGVRLLGVEPADHLRAAHSIKEIGVMVDQAAKGGLLDRFDQTLLRGAVVFGERDAASVMVPRTEMVAVRADATIADVRQIVLDTGHSRIPVYEGQLDHVVGFIHVKDMLKLDAADDRSRLPRELLRQMLVVPESRKLHPLLLDMRRTRRHVALVVDEHGGTAGIVTLEDLLEELVGEIRDEYDQSEVDIERLGDQRFIVPGSLRIDEAADRLSVTLPSGEYETLAGFLMDRLGRIPKRRDLVIHDGWRLRVLSMQRRRVERVLIERDATSPRTAEVPQP